MKSLEGGFIFLEKNKDKIYKSRNIPKVKRLEYDRLKNYMKKMNTNKKKIKDDNIVETFNSEVEWSDKSAEDSTFDEKKVKMGKSFAYKSAFNETIDENKMVDDDEPHKSNTRNCNISKLPLELFKKGNLNSLQEFIKYEISKEIGEKTTKEYEERNKTKEEETNKQKYEVKEEKTKSNKKTSQEHKETNTKTEKINEEYEEKYKKLEEKNKEIEKTNNETIKKNTENQNFQHVDMFELYDPNLSCLENYKNLEIIEEQIENLKK